MLGSNRDHRVPQSSVRRVERRDRLLQLTKPNLGREFADEVREAIQRIQDFPNAWALVVEERGIRRCQTHRFPYGAIYQVQEERILIIAVAHLKRNPNYWRRRADQA